MYKDNENLLLFLHLVENNSNLKFMVSEKMNYSDISKLLNWTIENNYVKIQGNNLLLTQKGKKVLYNLTGKKSKKFFIFNQFKYKIDKIDINDIYMPKK